MSHQQPTFFAPRSLLPPLDIHPRPSSHSDFGSGHHTGLGFSLRPNAAPFSATPPDAFTALYNATSLLQNLALDRRPSPAPVVHRDDKIWVCTTTRCLAHNGLGDTHCHICGSPRPTTSNPSTPPRSASSTSTMFSFTSSPSSATSQGSFPCPPQHRLPPSPMRFASSPWDNTVYATPVPLHQPIPPRNLNLPQPPIYHQQQQPPPPPVANLQHLISPSGFSLAQGGRVKNISGDDNNPILMFWPDNEQVPIPGQCRPPLPVGFRANPVRGPSGAILPPILNTGNVGPMAKQPLDWQCSVCSYTNWRRRKVCQQCFPYAPGNEPPSNHAERMRVVTALLLDAHQKQQKLEREHALRLTLANLEAPSSTDAGTLGGFPAYGPPPPLLPSNSHSSSNSSVSSLFDLAPGGPITKKSIWAMDHHSTIDATPRPFDTWTHLPIGAGRSVAANSPVFGRKPSLAFSDLSSSSLSSTPSTGVAYGAIGGGLSGGVGLGKVSSPFY